MGGFGLVDGTEVRTPEPDELGRLSRGGEVDHPMTREKEIKDRSKGDMLSKRLVILQTTWFILQSIARGVERLPITELELVTLGFATLNIATYALWWNKPLNVECPILLTRRATVGVDQGSRKREDNDGGVKVTRDNDAMTCDKQTADGVLESSIRRAVHIVFQHNSRDRNLNRFSDDFYEEHYYKRRLAGTILHAATGSLRCGRYSTRSHHFWIWLLLVMPIPETRSILVS